MDSSLEKALKFSNYMATLDNQKRIILEKFQEQTVYYFNGGQFTVDLTLLSYVNILLSSTSTGVLLDDKKIPILVTDLAKFYQDIFDTYHNSLTNYYNEYEQLKKSRTVEKLVEL